MFSIIRMPALWPSVMINSGMELHRGDRLLAVLERHDDAVLRLGRHDESSGSRTGSAKIE